MVLYIIGVGLFGYHSLTVHGTNTIKLCRENLYLPRTSESLYESFVNNGFYPEICDNDTYVAESPLYLNSKKADCALLCEGDFSYRKIYHDHIIPLAKKFNVTVKVVHNASVLNIVGCSGLQLYRFGESIPILSNLEKEISHKMLKKIDHNLKKKLHTLLYYDSITTEENEKTQFFFNNIMDCIKYHKCVLLHEQIKCLVLLTKNADTKIELNQVTFGDLSKLPYRNMFAFVICSDLHPVEAEALDTLTAYSKLKLLEKNNTLHLIGLGLGTPEDITEIGARAVRKSQTVYLESYTSTMIGGAEKLEIFHEKNIFAADREITEEKFDKIINKLQEGDVAFLVVGDPLSATTHADLLLRVLSENFNVNVINNVSIITAACVCGLTFDNFGEIVSIPFWDDLWKPESFFDKICSNIESNWHTLCLLDIKIKEISNENLAKGKKIYDPPRLMSASQAAAQLLQIIDGRPEPTLLKGDTEVIGLARIGTDEEEIVECTLQEMVAKDLGKPLHSLVIRAKCVSDFF